MTTPGPPLRVLRNLFTGTDDRADRLAQLAPATGRLALVDLDRLAPLLADKAALPQLIDLLAPSERALFAGFHYPKRKLEWLGGRLAGKYCLALLANTGNKPDLACFRDLAILPDEHGRPRTTSDPKAGSASSISISHSHRFAAALAVCRGPCGLDIQQPTTKLFKVQERFATDEEVVRMEILADPLVRLTALWSIKEAVKKGLLHDQPTFLGRIRLTAFTATRVPALWMAQCLIADDAATTIMVRVAEIDGYLIACIEGANRA